MRWAERTRLSPALGLFLLLCLATGSSKGQAEQLPIKIYTTADGLVRDEINRIVQDSHGYLWFCTAEGLSRFDGYKFTNYTTPWVVLVLVDIEGFQSQLTIGVAARVHES